MMEYTHQSVMVYLNLSEIFGTSTCILGLFPDKLNTVNNLIKLIFTFRTVTRKELYSVIDSLDDNKAAGPGEISIRLIKSCKLAIGAHLQFALNECIREKIFPTKMKLAYVTPVFKKK